MQQAPALVETLPAQSPSTTSPEAPPPTEPTDAEPESTPAPENLVPLIPGPRASRLQALFASTAKHTLDKINKDNFASCFPTIATKAPGTLEFVQRQMVERLGGLWNVRFLPSPTPTLSCRDKMTD
jgi:kinetochore protein NNF1